MTEYNSNLKITIITTDSRGTYLCFVLHHLKKYFNLDIEYVAPEAMTIKAMAKNRDLIIFDETEINKIKKMNLFFIRSLSRFVMFVYLSQVFDAKVLKSVYEASMDFVIQKDFSLTKPPAVLTHCINLILHQKNSFRYLTAGNHKVDVYKKTIEVNEEWKALTSREFLLIVLLSNNRNEYVSRDTIFKEVWGYDDVDSSRLVDHTISSIRKIVGKSFIENKSKLGYRLAQK